MTKEYLNVQEMAEVTGIGVSTLNKRRLTGDGPPFVKVGKSVRYHLATTLAWMASRQRQSTSTNSLAA